MFKKKSTIKEEDHVFASIQSQDDFCNIVIGTVTGVDNDDIGISGININPVGLKNKVKQGKTGPRSIEILKNPTPDNCILAFIYRVEYENYTGVLNIKRNNIALVSSKTYSVLDGWMRESLSELINNVLSLQEGDEKEQAKVILKQRMDTLYDKNLKRNLYSVCRSLKILT